MVALSNLSTMPRRAYSYSRVSDDPQAKPGRDGVRRQDDFAEQLSKEEGWALDDSLVFVDKGRSGYHGENLKPTADLARFLKLVKDRQITPGSVLIVENIDRLSRHEVDVAYDLFRGLLKAGIWIATKFPRRIYKPGSASFMDLMEPIWLMYLARQESLKKAERLTAKWDKRRRDAREKKAPIGRLCPAWLTLGDEGYDPIPGRFQTVQMIFRLAIQGRGCARIAAWLNEHSDEYPPFTGGNAKGKWIRQYVRKILRSRAPVGEFQPLAGRPKKPSGPPIAGFFPVIVDEAEWRIAQAAITGRRNTAGRPGHKEANLFTGLVREAHSREKMSIRVNNNGRRAKAYRYLVPLRIGETCRSGGGCPYFSFEEWILRSLGELTTKDVLPKKEAADERQNRITELASRNVGLQNRLQEIQEQLENPEYEGSVAVLAKSIDNLTKQVQANNKELDALKFEVMNSRSENLGRMQSLLGLLEEVRGTEQEEEIRQRIKAAIRWVVEEIWILVQPLSSHKRIVHALIYLRGGKRVYRQLIPRLLPSGTRVWNLRKCDFRAGDIGNVARKAAETQLVG